MVIGKKIVLKILSKVLSNEMSREEAANWARTVRECLDDKRCFYESSADEDVIWEAVIFVEGIDLMDSPTSYLHNTEDLKFFANSFNDLDNRYSLLVLSRLLPR